jgi:hypothetical protein
MAKVEYKYPQDIVEITERYINRCGNEQMELPTVEGLALELRVDDDTLNEWAKKHDDFGAVFKRLKLFQKVQLINGGMYGGKEINQAMFIFLLKVNHDMIETTREEHTGRDGKDLFPQPIADINVPKDIGVSEAKPTN